MQKKKRSRKLALNRETLRALAAEELEDVVGQNLKYPPSLNPTLAEDLCCW